MKQRIEVSLGVKLSLTKEGESIFSLNVLMFVFLFVCFPIPKSVITYYILGNKFIKVPKIKSVLPMRALRV